jgi:hypothetical protein
MSRITKRKARRAKASQKQRRKAKALSPELEAIAMDAAGVDRYGWQTMQAYKRQLYRLRAKDAMSVFNGEGT